MNEKDRVQELKKHFSFLETERHYWDRGLWQEISDYCNPLREDLQWSNVQGQTQGTKAYDGTAIYAVNLAADGTHGYMYNPATQWFNFRLPRTLKRLEGDPSVRMWIDEVQWVIYSALQDSNFYGEIRTFLKDWFSIGTASMLPEENLTNGKICFNTLHPREGYIAEDKYGVVDTFFRKTKLTAKQAAEQFDKEKFSEPLKNALQNNPYTLFEFLHAVFPRKDFNEKKLSSTNKRFASIWVELGSDKILKEGGYNMFPYMVSRYSKSGNEVYGRGPASFALPEIKSLQSIAKDLLGAAQMAVRPPLNIPAEMKGKVRLSPLGMNYYGSDYNRVISPINTGINFPVGLDREKEKREIIEKHFHVDFFLMLQRAEREMTAREIIERMGEKASVLSASIGNLSVVTDSILDYVFYLENEAGRIPPIPDILAQYGGTKLDIVYMGPLAQAQRRLFETQGIRLGLELAMPIFQIQPDTMDEINWGETLKRLVISNGFPQPALNTPEMIMQIRQGRAAQQAADKQKIDADLNADTMKKLAQALKNAGNVGQLQQLAEGLSPNEGVGNV